MQEFTTAPARMRAVPRTWFRVPGRCVGLWWFGG